MPFFNKLAVGTKFVVSGTEEPAWRKTKQVGCCRNPKKHNAVQVEDDSKTKQFSGATKVEIVQDE